MKKIAIGAFLCFFFGVAGFGLWYVYLLQVDTEVDSTSFVSKWDLMDRIEPVEFSMQGQTFIVPGLEEVVLVEMNLIAPGNVRDYPMGRVNVGEERIVLTALDDFLSEEVNGRQAIVLRKNTPDRGDEFYLGIISIVDDVVTPITSLFIGDHIRVRNIRTENNNVVVNYDVHDREQRVTETPRVNTTATFDIVEERIVIAGRDPKTEEVIQFKRFAGVYLWSYTKRDGDTIEPIVPDKFTLRFNGNRIELGTDCNSGSGTFTTEPLPSTAFTVGTIATTSMFCESEQEADYFAMMAAIESYEEKDDGSIIFSLGTDQSMVFVPRDRVLEFGS